MALFVRDIDARSAWCAALLSVPVEREDLRYGFVLTLHGEIVGVQPNGATNAGGGSGTTPFWKWPI